MYTNSGCRNLLQETNRIDKLYSFKPLKKIVSEIHNLTKGDLYIHPVSFQERSNTFTGVAFLNIHENTHELFCKITIRIPMSIIGIPLQIGCLV